MPLSRFTCPPRFAASAQAIEPPMPRPPRRFGDTVTSRSERDTALAYARRLSRVWVIGDATETPIPADPDALRDGGTRFLTDAFRRFGSLDGDNEVTAVTACAE